jgi:hypothetical protein
MGSLLCIDSFMGLQDLGIILIFVYLLLLVKELLSANRSRVQPGPPS